MNKGTQISNEQIDRLKEQIIYEIPKEFGIWIRAGKWLEKNHKDLIKEAIEQARGCFNSEGQREQFKESIDEHLQCILRALRTFDSNCFKELEHKEYVIDRKAYKMAFRNIHDKIGKDNNGSLDNDASDLLSKIFEELMRIL